ncbi:hypothetical protein GCM10009665_66090 [Kitasatospora nipponensis]|uniref:DUF1023 domain-containing protein n=1 Tax=Kitasatospora nipponensis TaxID=258049 RepID=A0ABN1WYW3_9ACTN
MRQAQPDAAASAAAVSAWWSTRHAAERQDLIESCPELVGNRDGIPAADRDRANRRRLAGSRAALHRELERLGTEPRPTGVLPGREPPGHRRWRLRREAVLGKLKGLEDIEGRLTHSRAPHFAPTYLLGFDTEGIGHAIVAVNDPDTAHNVVTFVPGSTARLAGMTGDMDKAYEIEAAARLAAPDRTTSAIAWSGYDAPQSRIAAIRLAAAHGAKDALLSFVTALRLTHRGAPAHSTVLGHSYGSTVVGLTLRDRGLPVDSVLLLGSPGAGVRHARQLRIEPSRVHVGRGSHDWIRFVAGLRHGRDPMRPAFGARRIPTGDTRHGRYWAPGTVSWTLIGQVAAGALPAGG